MALQRKVFNKCILDLTLYSSNLQVHNYHPSSRKFDKHEYIVAVNEYAEKVRQEIINIFTGKISNHDRENLIDSAWDQADYKSDYSEAEMARYCNEEVDKMITPSIEEGPCDEISLSLDFSQEYGVNIYANMAWKETDEEFAARQLTHNNNKLIRKEKKAKKDNEAKKAQYLKLKEELGLWPQVEQSIQNQCHGVPLRNMLTLLLKY